jgi:membrane-bound ClpP family serine protease
MIILGLILLVVGYVLPLSLLITLGIILVVVGVILELLGSTGHQIGSRRHYW